MKKINDKVNNISNILVTGSELKRIYRENNERTKRRLHRKVEVQKWSSFSGDAKERAYQESANDAYDMCLSIINAKLNL